MVMLIILLIACITNSVRGHSRLSNKTKWNNTKHLVPIDQKSDQIAKKLRTRDPASNHFYKSAITINYNNNKSSTRSKLFTGSSTRIKLHKSVKSINYDNDNYETTSRAELLTRKSARKKLHKYLNNIYYDNKNYKTTARAESLTDGSRRIRLPKSVNTVKFDSNSYETISRAELLTGGLTRLQLPKDVFTVSYDSTESYYERNERAELLRPESTTLQFPKSVVNIYYDSTERSYESIEREAATTLKDSTRIEKVSWTLESRLSEEQANMSEREHPFLDHFKRDTNMDEAGALLQNNYDLAKERLQSKLLGVSKLNMKMQTNNKAMQKVLMLSNEVISIEDSKKNHDDNYDNVEGPLRQIPSKQYVYNEKLLPDLPYVTFDTWIQTRSQINQDNWFTQKEIKGDEADTSNSSDLSQTLMDMNRNNYQILSKIVLPPKQKLFDIENRKLFRDLALIPFNCCIYNEPKWTKEDLLAEKFVKLHKVDTNLITDAFTINSAYSRLSSDTDDKNLLKTTKLKILARQPWMEEDTLALKYEKDSVESSDSGDCLQRQKILEKDFNNAISLAKKRDVKLNMYAPRAYRFGQKNKKECFCWKTTIPTTVSTTKSTHCWCWNTTTTSTTTTTTSERVFTDSEFHIYTKYFIQRYKPIAVMHWLLDLYRLHKPKRWFDIPDFDSLPDWRPVLRPYSTRNRFLEQMFFEDKDFKNHRLNISSIEENGNKTNNNEFSRHEEIKILEAEEFKSVEKL